MIKSRIIRSLYVLLMFISSVYIVLFIIDLINYFEYGKFYFFMYKNLSLSMKKINVEHATLHDLIVVLKSNNTWYSRLLAKSEVPLCVINGVVGLYQYFFGRGNCIYLINIVFSLIILFITIIQ